MQKNNEIFRFKDQAEPLMLADYPPKLQEAYNDPAGDIMWRAGIARAASILIGKEKTSGDINTVIHLLRDSDRPASHDKLMQDAATLLECHRAVSIELHDLKHAIREAMVRIEGEKCDLSEGAGSHEVLHNAGVQRDLDIIKQCCGEFL